MIKLDKKLDKLEKSVIEMGNEVIAQHKRCAEILKTHDNELAKEVIENDAKINEYETNINDQAIAGFALLSPVATDLRRIIVAIKISSDLERIGDYAKSLAAYILKSEEEYKDLLNHAVVMETKLIKMLKDIMKAYKEKDVKRAYEIPEQDDILNGLLKEFRYKIYDEKDANLKHIFYLTNVFRNIERAGDHSVNICEHIVYLCKGVQYDFEKTS